MITDKKESHLKKGSSFFYLRKTYPILLFKEPERRFPGWFHTSLQTISISPGAPFLVLQYIIRTTILF